MAFDQAEGGTLTMDYYAAVGPGEHPAVITLFAQSSFTTVPLNADMHALLDPLIQQKGEAAALQEASPITYVTRDAPPFLLIQGDRDGYIPFSEDTNLQAALGYSSVEE